jgi:hypothetical protein
MRNRVKINCSLAVCFLAAVFLVTGCARSQIKDIYPSPMRADAPLVLAIPGINLPSDTTPQEKQFGGLVRMLADRGIPTRVLNYDTGDNPLRSSANLTFDEESISRTVVGPMVVEAILGENARRAQLGLPPVKEVVVFSFSQGSVIASHLLQRYHRFKTTYQDWRGQYGPEWSALQKDPEFVSLMSANMDFQRLERIKFQRELLFKSDLKLKRDYARAEKKLKQQTARFIRQNDKLKNWVTASRRKGGEHKMVKEVLTDYAACRGILDVDFTFCSTAASFYGSLIANRASGLMEISALFGDTKLKQVKDTRLGSKHQIQETKRLCDLKARGRYPYTETGTLFIVGAHGDQGDGFIEQPSAHLVDHAVVRVRKKAAGGVSVAVDRLPHLPVVGLKIMHIPDNNIFNMFGIFGHSWGAAYIKKGNPVFPYLVAFIDKDWHKIKELESGGGQDLRQFMLVVVADKKTPDGRTLSVVKKGATENVQFDLEAFYNPDSNAVVWTGKFICKEEHMHPFEKGKYQGAVTFEVSDGTGPGEAFKVPLYPGCNTSVKVEAEKERPEYK